MNSLSINIKYLPALVQLLLDYSIYDFNVSKANNDDNELFIVSTTSASEELLSQLANEAHGCHSEFIFVKDVLKISKDIDINLTDDPINNSEAVIDLLDKRFLTSCINTAIEAALDKWKYIYSDTRDQNDLN